MMMMVLAQVSTCGPLDKFGRLVVVVVVVVVLFVRLCVYVGVVLGTALNDN